jgi:protein required for attachment to host cells
MSTACIAVVDASRARLFTFERDAEQGRVDEELTEQRDLVNPARRQRPSELFSESRPGSSRTGGRQYAFDDHRDAHMDALDAEFARMIVAEVTGLVHSAHADRLIVCASPHMLGELRSAGDLPTDIAIEEMPRDLVKLTPPQLRDQLADYNILPPRPRREPS